MAVHALEKLECFNDVQSKSITLFTDSDPWGWATRVATIAQPNSYLSPFAQTIYHKQPILLVVLVLCSLKKFHSPKNFQILQLPPFQPRMVCFLINVKVHMLVEHWAASPDEPYRGPGPGTAFDSWPSRLMATSNRWKTIKIENKHGVSENMALAMLSKCYSIRSKKSGLCHTTSSGYHSNFSMKKRL